jgi:hypothetical protein
MAGVALKVLIVDPDLGSANKLEQTFRGMHESVQSTQSTVSLRDAVSLLKDFDINAIFIDPISFEFEESESFILSVREHIPYIVFVLYLDFEAFNQAQDKFYEGNRRQFRYYYKFDKNTPTASFKDELTVTIKLCRSYLSDAIAEFNLEKLKGVLSSFLKAGGEPVGGIPIGFLQNIQGQLATLHSGQNVRQDEAAPKTVFLSYRFAEREYIKGFEILLHREGFSVITGQDANTFISQAILERIRSCRYFVCLMTKADEKKDGSYTTSPWLLEEKGAALAMGKKIVLMVEDGVKDIGGLQGDWQRIHFSAKSFTNAAIRAIDQLKSFEKEGI